MLGTEEVEGLLILLAEVVISLEGRASPAAACKVVGRSMMMYKWSNEQTGALNNV